MSASQIACMSFNNFTCFVCLLPVFILLLQCWNPSCLSCPLSSCLPVTAGQPPVCISITHLHLCCLLSSCLFVYWSVCLSASLLSTPVPLQSPLPAVSVAILPTYVCVPPYLPFSHSTFVFCLSSCLFIYWFVYLSVSRSAGASAVCMSVYPFLCCLPVILLSLCLPACLSASLSPASIFLLPPMLSVCHPVCLSNDLPVLKSVCRLPPSFCYNSFSHSTCVVRLSSWVFVYWSVSLSPAAMTLCTSVCPSLCFSACLSAWYLSTNTDYLKLLSLPRSTK